MPNHISWIQALGIKPDVEKLANIRQGIRLSLVLATANPGEDAWLSGVEKFNSKFRPLYIESLTNPRDFPQFYFLGLLTVKGMT